MLLFRRYKNARPFYLYLAFDFLLQNCIILLCPNTLGSSVDRERPAHALRTLSTNPFSQRATLARLPQAPLSLKVLHLSQDCS